MQEEKEGNIWPAEEKKNWENENIWLEKEEKAGEGKRGERKNGGTNFLLWKESGKN